MLKKSEKIYWLLGGIPKRDKFVYLIFIKNIKAYIYGKNNKKFIADLKNKIY